jgi:hypothetical protein
MKSKIRKVLLLVIAVAMVGGGLYLAGAELLTASRISGRFLAGGALLVLFGGYLLWVDFVAPALGVKTWEE